MKKYLLFTGMNYYPSGGWDDFEKDFDTVLEAALYSAGKNRNHDWFQIINSETGWEVTKECEK